MQGNVIEDYSHDPLILENFENRIKNNRYPGRGIIVGRNQDQHWFQVYWIMGRSENSRNRIFTYHDHILKTEPADATKVEDPSLIIYNAMREFDHCYIATNGVQTDDVYEGMQQGMNFDESLRDQFHEPDAPNYTPRISSCLDMRTEKTQLHFSIIKANRLEQQYSERHFFQYDHVACGSGYCITTYQVDGNPIPSFEGTPFLIPLEGNAQQIADVYWDTLDEDNRISLAVKAIDPNRLASATLIINKYNGVEN